MVLALFGSDGLTKAQLDPEFGGITSDLDLVPRRLGRVARNHVARHAGLPQAERKISDAEESEQVRVDRSTACRSR